MRIRRQINPSNLVLWAVYLALLLVLLPHTAWLFSRFEAVSSAGQTSGGGMVTAWAAAFAFEAAIAVLTHKLARHIEDTPRYKSHWKRFAYRYLNAFSVGLLMAVGVSGLANLAHAVEYGQRLRIFEQWSVSPVVYQLAFGGVLPVVSLLFARVLSNVSDGEGEANEDEEKIRALRSSVREAEQRAKESEQRAMLAEQALSEYARLRSESMAERVLAAHQLWPALPQRSVAVVADSSPAYVSEVLANGNGQGE